ncbi:MAG: GGDEF domain-containing protein [bacterium]|nr:GGDEF domain-containing protein [bacterium]
MFWKREKPKTAPAKPTPVSPRGGSQDAPVSAEQSLDLLAEFLRIFGDFAFDLEHASADEIRERCDAWARHLIVGIEPPDYPPEADPWEGGAEATRDLPGLRRFVDETRREEHSFIGQSLSNMLEAIWAFIGGLRHSLSFEQETDERVADRLCSLESAAGGDSTARLKQEALETVSLVRETMERRGSQQQSLIRSLGTRLETMRAELTVVREQAACDGLTGLFNRSSLDEHMLRLFDLRNLFGRQMALFMIDIDHFKWVNDTHGHSTGDVVLKAVADSLLQSFSRKEDFAARYGGEEFAVVLQEGRMGNLQSLAERCLERLRDLEFKAGDETLRITASLGVAMLHERESPAAWLERADAALYDAKQAGRDRIVVHTDDRRG